MIGEIVLYAPYNAELGRVSKLNSIVMKLAKELGLAYKGPIYRDDKRICVYYEDKSVKVYVYVDDPTRDVNFEKVEMSIRLMATIALKEMIERKLRIREKTII